MNRTDTENGVREADQIREELYDTLAQLRDRLDYAQRVDDAMGRAKERLAEEQKANPAGFAIGVAAVAGIAGLAVWGIARRVIRAFGGN